MPPLTDSQQISVIIPSIVACSLSTLGSGSIIHLTLKQKLRGTYQRLLLCMSCFDIVHNICYALQPFLVPESSGGRIWSFGNARTCSALGFFAQFGITIISFYNVMLNLNFLLVVRYGMNDTKMKKLAEPVMHLFSISYPLITASVGLGIGLYSELQLGFGCWIGEYPKGCNENVNNPCISTLIGWIYSGIPLLGSLLFLILSNLAIYLKVRHTIAQSERFASRGSQQQRNVRQRDVGTQATLYVFAYFSCIGWMLAVRILESNGVSRDDEQSIYGILLLTGIFYPAQGFWNFLVFMRPKYMKQRRLNPNVSRWVAMKRAFTAGQLARGVTSAAATQQSRAPRSVNTSVSIEQSVESADFPTECEAKEASPQLLLQT